MDTKPSDTRPVDSDLELAVSERPSSLALYWRSPAPGGIRDFSGSKGRNQ